jgi:hypothetical protein
VQDVPFQSWICENDRESAYQACSDHIQGVFCMVLKKTRGLRANQSDKYLFFRIIIDTDFMKSILQGLAQTMIGLLYLVVIIIQLL